MQKRIVLTAEVGVNIDVLGVVRMGTDMEYTLGTSTGSPPCP